MQLHQIKPTKNRKAKKRVGRGGKRGTFSGRGDKGQRSRAGKRMQPAIREHIKRYPKLRGYRFNPKSKSLVAINLSEIADKFKDGEAISPRSLLEKKMISKIKGKVPQVKILGNGELDKKLFVNSCFVSKTARDKIEKAGGEVRGN